MSIKGIIKEQYAVVYDYVIKHIKVQDIGNIAKILSDIWKSCKIAKDNKTCLGDCIHCEYLIKIIKGV